jgi:predicted enzyme involved in methoxymalonyl-ACP biosynthesis
MIIKHELQRVAGGQAITDDLDRFYNHQAYWRDHQLPSYRQVVVAAKADRPAVLHAIQIAFETQDAAQSPDLNGVFAMWQALRWNQILNDHAAESKQLQAHAAAEITRLQAENQRLVKLVQGYESGRLIRFIAALKLAVAARR